MDSTAVIGAGASDNEPGEATLEPAPFRVLGDNIIVELVEREETTESGLLLVQERKQRPPDVTVVGIGAEAVRHFESEEHLVVELGTCLMVRRHEMTRLELGDDGRELYVLKPSAVIGHVR